MKDSNVLVYKNQCSTISIENDLVHVIALDGTKYSYELGSKEAFDVISDLWLRSGWDNKYVYGFSWFGRPIIQLPEDMFKIQELIYRLRPKIIIETGVAHGGSLVFYAGILEILKSGIVIGVDIDIRKHNRAEIDAHILSNRIKLIEGSSIDQEIFNQVCCVVEDETNIMVILDSNHSKKHVLKELQLYSKLVPVGSYIVACDGIMKGLVGAPRSNDDWYENNPQDAVFQFLSDNKNFILDEPQSSFNEGNITKRVTYWPNSFIKRIA